MSRDIVFLSLFLLIPGLVLLHLLVAPYTKVEESFHVQAIHDIETYGIPSLRDATTYLQEHYDHFKFPGAVPRTFIGALVLSELSRPFIWLNENVDRQVLARAILGLFNASALMSYASGIKRAFGQPTAIWYLLFQASQFHVLYYASRTLSNMFAFGITTLAMRYLLSEPGVRHKYRTRCRLSLCLLTIVGIIFRSELALFLATHILFLLLTGRVSLLREVIPAGILGLSIGLASTVSVDSFFWQQFPLWPELAAFKFNVVSGQASAWGTQPWHFYFSNAIPRLLLNPCTYLIGIPVALSQSSTRAATAYLVTPSLAFVALFSSQPHKEWRFILYAIPPLTAAAALGASYIWTHRTKSLIYRLLSLVMLLSPLASFAISTFVLLPSSAANYPGAYALRALHENHAETSSQSEISVYLGNLACQTGVTRFLQIPSNTPTVAWKYDKTEDETTKSSSTFWDQFDYALVEAVGPEESRLTSGPDSRWENVEVVNGFAGVRVLRPGEEARGSVEEGVLRGIGVERAVGVWEKGRELVRGFVTKGWWVELRIEPRIRIMRRVE
ncbi:dolichyl-P-Man:Man(7)GlcNAc(2)-PP-dolichol alpha-1,6-mannosyltransferase [Aspergillus glaucus CBS 516.65]|uniref:Mannosyltransferase n=1 Tax=Aspergillus glaucus CBS 516.65 TaxID=1160497 RepID=A0A1L9VDM7_ASPGL|nr:hypothetical protein ASPGLDRAFT_68054 [Aspergillus glaucus CBS 516.65]OJJ82071.1 hypothetical protein ASPGLDRAFT_68054 [Aspergillus glaucus CBS 516.65]